MRLVLMCGMSFAGKSAVARQLVGALDAELISLDAINAERGLDGGQGIRWKNGLRRTVSLAAEQLRCSEPGVTW